MKTKYFKTAFRLSLCFIFSAASSKAQSPDTLIMSAGVNYIYGGGTGSCGGWGGGWGGHYNLSFDQNRNMPPGDMMYVEVETWQYCCGNAPWHKLTGYYYPLNWYNDTVNQAFTGSTNGTIHTSIDISSGQGSVAEICIRFVYISAPGNNGIHASISNATYNLAPTHLNNVTVTTNGAPCGNPLSVTFNFSLNCSRCQNGSSSDDVRIDANFGDGNDTSYIVCCPGQFPTLHLNHTYNSIGTFNSNFHVWNGYGGGYDTLIIGNKSPSSTITSNGSVSFCSGDSIILNAPFYSNRAYQWIKGGIDIPGATASSYTATVGGNYKVTVTNTLTGCAGTTPIGTILTVNPKPNASITPQGPTTFCSGDNVVLKANSGAGLIYKWKKDGTFISGANGINYTAFVAGTYKVQVTNPNGCKKTSPGIDVIVPCREGGEINEIISNISIFPNPTSGKFTIQSTKKINQLTITNFSGQIIFKKDFSHSHSSPVEINLNKEAKGIYLIQVVTETEVINQKIIVQ